VPPQPGGGAKLQGSEGAKKIPLGETPSEDALFNFNDQPLIDVIQHIAKLTGKNFDIDPNIGASTVTIIAHDKFPPDMAYEVLESVLNSRGYSLVENLDGKLVRVIPTPDVKPPDVNLYVGGAFDDLPKGKYDTFATHIVPIKYADPSEVATALQQLGSKSAKVDSYLPTSTLIITDTTNGLRRMLKFIELADIPGNETTMEIFTLEYTRADVIAGQLEQVLLSPEDGGGALQPSRTTTVRPTTRPTRPTTRNVPGANTSEVIGSAEEVLRMVPDERLNALIVVATDGMMEQVRDLVVRLDSPTPYERNNMHIYELLNADAELMEQALQPLIGTTPRREASGGGGATGGGGAAPAQSADVQIFDQRVQIARYDQTNSLLIVASPQDYKLLEAYIARLDVPQRQVYVKASVMDVSLNDEFSLNFNAAGVGGEDGFGMTATGLLPVVDLAEGLAGTATLATDVLSLGSGGGLSAGIFDDITIDVAGQEVKLPFVPVLFQALETLSDLEVLSQPSLTTIDNEESSIVVGREVPFITGSSRPATNADGQVTSTSFGTTRVQREDVGVKLTVTPQISEGDNVLLEVSIEVSDIATADPNVGNVDLVGPTTNKSEFSNKVLVKDGATAVLAGLIRDSTDRSRNQAPILGDIPVLGTLFRSKGNKRQKSNLVVLITPHIVKESIDMERLTLHKLNEYHDTNLDELFEQGFFKRVKRKQQLRKKHRPTFEESAAITGRDTGSVNSQAFRRGDIKR
jgi:general secretion pathway protein D